MYCKEQAKEKVTLEWGKGGKRKKIGSSAKSVTTFRHCAFAKFQPLEEREPTATATVSFMNMMVVRCTTHKAYVQQGEDHNAPRRDDLGEGIF